MEVDSDNLNNHVKVGALADADLGVASSSSATRMLLITVAAVFFTEAAVMAVLAVLPPLPTVIEAAVDSLALSILVFPFLFLYIFKPLVKQIESRNRAEQALRDSQSLLAEAQRVAHVGHWVWEVANDRVEWSNETHRIFGVVPGMAPTNLETFLGCVHPLDREAVRSSMESASRDGGGYEIEHRILVPGEGEKVLLAKAEADAAGPDGRVIGIVQDITERRRAQQALEEASAELDRRVQERTAELAETNRALQREQNFVDAVVDVAGALVIVLDRAGDVVRFNKTCEATSGYSFEEVRRHGIWDLLIPQEEQEAVAETFKNLCAGDSPIQNDNHWRTKDGGRRFISWSSTALFSPDGGVEFVVGMGVDNTDRRRAEIALRNSEERYRTILRTVREGFWTVDLSATIIDVNDAYCRLSGYSREELIGQHISLVEGEENRDEAERHLKRIIVEGHDRFETRHRHKDGRMLEIEVSVTYIPLEGGLLFTFLRDVTARNRAADELARSRAELEAIIYSTADATVFTDPQRRIALVNPAFERMFGYRADEVYGRDTHFLDLEERPLEGRFSEEDDPAGSSFEIQCRRKDGSTLWVETQAVAVHDSRGTLLGYVGVHRDVSQRKKDEAQIRSSLLEKEVLLKEIHHRVKNNLQIIASMLNLQLDHVHDEAALVPLRESQNRIRSLALIHEKLYRSRDLANIEFGDYVRDLAAAIVSTGSRTTIPIVVNTEIDEMALGIDTTIPLGLIINELVSNCIKHAFTGRTVGHIRISLQLDRKERPRLVVEDDGVGLAADFKGATEHSLGLQLVEVLAAQLDGTLSWGGEEGARFEVDFMMGNSEGRVT